MGLTETQVDPGAVYRVLRQLEAEGAVVSAWDTSGGGPARRNYELTEMGRARLASWVTVIARGRRRCSSSRSARRSCWRIRAGRSDDRREGSVTMRYAIAADGDRVAPHFGRCERYVLVDVHGGLRRSRARSWLNPGHEPGLLPRLLNEEGVACVVAGGAGRALSGSSPRLNMGIFVGVSGSDRRRSWSRSSPGELEPGRAPVSTERCAPAGEQRLDRDRELTR
jgi:DNA-binding PadR family transcriptional regulator